MARVNFMWYDGFLLSMLLFSTLIVALNWKLYNSCKHHLHMWTLVDYATIFIFRILMFVDDGIANGMRVDLGWQQRDTRFWGRVVILSILCLLLYPFLWAWTIIGSLWFAREADCLPKDGQKFGIIVWLALSYCLLICLLVTSMHKFLARRKAHLARAIQESPVSVYEVLVDMIRVPDWLFEAVNRQMRGAADQENGAYYPGLYMTPTQRGAVEILIQQLPVNLLETVPAECNECLICLEEFQVGNQVRELPCAHNFHVDCIDKWLLLNVNCPRCRGIVFPDLDSKGLSLVQIEMSE